ncbi:inositol-3-phosphate synthase [Roseomonas sp. SSH11]|uniref:Inositol-3-phosphate synthase n=1 Tax=Pararoseomonas baculiformis TaxID=2820812 RepID=A0ABS4AFU7_9PROT|nr:inositol-3-phosphate synthase [Pararoseomonas baculiformis]MBP0445876.1 inositol-3-phosphate synthase [Pararoseomonas baculiformis]
MPLSGSGRRLGVAIVGVGGAVATTAVAGVEVIRRGSNRLDGLPLADLSIAGMADYRDMTFGGWDLDGSDLAAAAGSHRVLSDAQLSEAGDALAAIRPWPAVGSGAFCRGVSGANKYEAASHRDAVRAISDDLRRFRESSRAEGVVMINLASTERMPGDDEALHSLDAFERALDRNDPVIGPAMLYAYAAIESGVPYGNFTPSLAADAPALKEFAKQRNVPVAGKDGKTGQTMMKTVLAPALKARALHVDGWFSTNILGNRDGEALRDPDSLASKLDTKGNVLDSMLGYHVEDHLVDIRYYRPRGDDKEAWDNIDISGFLGHRMQIKVNFLCKDSVLAAPLALEIARVLDLAQQRGQGGVQEQLSVFFKAPMVANGHAPEHAFHLQERMLMDWLGAPQGSAQ